METVQVDPEHSATNAFMEQFDARPQECVNTIVLSTKQQGERFHTLALVPAHVRLDSKALKKALGGRTSFLPMDEALAVTGMERDSIGPIGAPEHLDVIADPTFLLGDRFILGGGLTRRKYIVNRAELLELINRPCEGIYTE